MPDSVIFFSNMLYMKYTFMCVKTITFSIEKMFRNSVAPVELHHTLDKNMEMQQIRSLIIMTIFTIIQYNFFIFLCVCALNTVTRSTTNINCVMFDRGEKRCPHANTRVNDFRKLEHPRNSCLRCPEYEYC